jgi:hypothetical protein
MNNNLFKCKDRILSLKQYALLDKNNHWPTYVCPSIVIYVFNMYIIKLCTSTLMCLINKLKKNE